MGSECLGETGLLQCISKLLYTSKALVGILLQCSHDHLLDCRRNAWKLFTQRGRSGSKMLRKDFRKGASKGNVSRQPLIDDDPQGILITSLSWFALHLFR